MLKLKIFNSTVKVEKKVELASQAGRYINFKVLIGRVVNYYCFDTLRCLWHFGEKSSFIGEIVSLTKGEQSEICDLCRFQIIFQTYEYTLGRRNFDLSKEVVNKFAPDWSEQEISYNDFDYVVEIIMKSWDSLWGSQSNMSIFAQIPGHMTCEGGNLPLDVYYEEFRDCGILRLEVSASAESFNKRLKFQPPKERITLESSSKLALMFFYYKLLPTYYMSAFII